LFIEDKRHCTSVAAGIAEGVLAGRAADFLENRDRRGAQTLSIVSFGGSFTTARQPDLNGTNYAVLFVEYLSARFPDMRFLYRNFGIGATGAYFSYLCYNEMVSGITPDLAFVEYSVNGRKQEVDKLVRLLLSQNVTVVYVDVVSHPVWHKHHEVLNDTQLDIAWDLLVSNDSESYEFIRKTYGLPAASFRGIMRFASKHFREVLLKRAWRPNDHHFALFGHQLLAETLVAMFDSSFLSSANKSRTQQDYSAANSMCYTYAFVPALTLPSPSITSVSGTWVVSSVGTGKRGLVGSGIGSYVEFSCTLKSKMQQLTVGYMASDVTGREGLGIIELSLNNRVIGLINGHILERLNVQNLVSYQVNVSNVQRVRLTITGNTTSEGHNFHFVSVFFAGTFEQRNLKINI
jgi:hypothetical protein